MRDVVIVGAVRSPLGKRNGSLSTVHPVDLSAQVLSALAERTGIDPAIVDDVIFGCVTQTGEQGGNIGRGALLSAGWPESVPATTVDRQCGSSQQTVNFAAASIAAGHYDVAVAGGVESMTRVPMMTTVIQGPGDPVSPGMRRRYGDSLVHQGLSAELIAQKWGIDRNRSDSISLRSHQRAARAQAEGRFDKEIIPIIDFDTKEVLLAKDEGVRPDANLESMGKLKPAFVEDGVVTAGNASQISDGAAALLLMEATRAEQLGIKGLGRLHSVSVVGVDPITMLTGPIPATEKVMARSGLSLDDIGVFEINEAFAVVLAAWEDEINADTEKVNPNGGAIALGHPLGGSGARIMTTMLHHMLATNTRYGLQSMCEGGGMANATILELV